MDVRVCVCLRVCQLARACVYVHVSACFIHDRLDSVRGFHPCLPGPLPVGAGKGMQVPRLKRMMRLRWQFPANSIHSIVLEGIFRLADHEVQPSLRMRPIEGRGPHLDHLVLFEQWLSGCSAAGVGGRPL